VSGRGKRLPVLVSAIVLAAAGASLGGATPAFAATPAATATCTEGSRQSAAAIGRDSMEEVRTVDAKTTDGRTVLSTIKLRYSATHHCVWGLISGSPGDPVWIDRQRADEARWSGPLGQRDIQRGNATTYTAAFALPGTRARACGNGYERIGGQRRPAPIACTDWYSEDFVATPGPGAPVGGQAPQANVTPNMALARQIQAMASQGKITFGDRASDFPAADAADRSLARLQIDDLAAGKAARYSTRCDKTQSESPTAYNRNNPSTAAAYKAGRYPFAAGVPADNASATAVLRFLVTLGNQQPITVNTLFGQCHFGPASRHHAGKAVDLGCDKKVPDGNTLDGLIRNGETCAKNGHWHYSVDGQ
jgi:hypothetical protein